MVAGQSDTLTSSPESGKLKAGNRSEPQIRPYNKEYLKMYSISNAVTTSTQPLQASRHASRPVVCLFSMIAFIGFPSSQVQGQPIPTVEKIEVPPSTNLLAGNSDSADPFFSNDGERLYFLSSADNLTPQAQQAGEVVQLFQWSPESDEVSNIHLNPGNGIPRLGGLLEILESQDGSGFYFTAAIEGTDHSVGSQIFYHDFASTQSTLLTGDNGSPPSGNWSLVDLGPEGQSPLATTDSNSFSFSESQASNSNTVYYDGDHQTWRLAVPRDEEAPANKVIPIGSSRNGTHFIFKQNSLWSQESDYSNIRFSSNLGDAGEMITFDSNNAEEFQVFYFSSVFISPDRTTAVALGVVTKFSKEALFLTAGPDPVVYKIDLNSMSPTLIPIEITRDEVKSWNVHLSHTGAKGIVVESDSFFTSATSTLTWLDVIGGAIKEVDFKALYPDENWVCIGFWGTTEDLTLINSSRKIARYDASENTLEVHPWEGADLSYTVAPSGQQIAIQTSMALDPELDDNGLQDIYWVDLTQAEPERKPVLISRAARPAPIQSLARLSSVASWAKSSDQTPDRILVSGSQSEWGSESSERKNQEFYYDPSNQEVVPVIPKPAENSNTFVYAIDADFDRTKMVYLEKDLQAESSALSSSSRLMIYDTSTDTTWNTVDWINSDEININEISFSAPAIAKDGTRAYALAEVNGDQWFLCELNLISNEALLHSVPENYELLMTLIQWDGGRAKPLVSNSGDLCVLATSDNLPNVDTLSGGALMFQSTTHTFYPIPSPSDQNQDSANATDSSSTSTYSPIRPSMFSSGGNRIIVSDTEGPGLYLLDLQTPENLEYQEITHTPNFPNFTEWDFNKSPILSEDGQSVVLFNLSEESGTRQATRLDFEKNQFALISLSNAELNFLQEGSPAIEYVMNIHSNPTHARFVVQSRIHFPETGLTNQIVYFRDLQSGAWTEIEIPGRYLSGLPSLSSSGNRLLIKSMSLENALSDSEVEFHIATIDTPENLIDSDQDGLPDSWEENFFKSLEKDGNQDSDLDGLTDLQEYLIESDPTNPNSGLRLEVLATPNSNQITLSWNSSYSAAGPGFFIETKAAQSEENWTRIDRPVTIIGKEAIVEESVPSGQAMRIYRLGWMEN
jgi:hypothetical protein